MNRLIILALVILSSCAKTNKIEKLELRKEDKIVIAHRGASGYLPEHTLEAKAMAYAMGAHYLEQDIVLSKDNVPIVIHDIYLDAVTNVAKIFENRKRIDGRYYVIDFTFDELQQLKVNERIDLKTGKTLYSKRFPIAPNTFQLHSLQQEIEFIQGLNKSTGKNVGIYPEIKDPEFHRAQGKDISKIVLDVLRNYGYTNKSDNCILQCFSSTELKRVRNELKSELFLVQLLDLDIESISINEIATYANGIGPWYKQIIFEKNAKGERQISNLVKQAQENNLKIHAYTFRFDNLGDFNSYDELLQVALFDVGIDGVFTDFPDKTIQFIDKFKQ